MEHAISRGRASLKWIELSLPRLRANARVLRQRIGPGVKLMAVVKSGAYGHGATRLARGLIDAGADALGVVSLDEALDLRAVGIRAPIHILSYVPAERADEIVRDEFNPVVLDRAFVEALEAAGARGARSVEVSVKVETGMNRFGFEGNDLDEVMDLLGRTRHVKVAGLCTHFARSDVADAGPTQAQLGRLLAAIERFRGRGHRLERSHAANSAATLLHPATHLQMVRCGLALYGLYPSPEVRAACAGSPLQPVLEFKARIVEMRTVRKGDAVSYGGTWVAPTETRLAVLPVGYADGYRWGLSNRSHVLIRGIRAPVRGRVCMDLCMVDVTGIPGVACGDEVTLISHDPSSGITADDLASVLGTINYEVLCGLSSQIERVIVP